MTQNHRTVEDGAYPRWCMSGIRAVWSSPLTAFTAGLLGVSISGDAWLAMALGCILVMCMFYAVEMTSPLAGSVGVHSAGVANGDR